MPILFNTILTEAGIDPKDVRLLRHQDQSSEKGKTPYELWRVNRPAFEDYQSTQTISNRPKFESPYWAAFVGTPAGETLFVGLYTVRYLGLLKEDRPMPNMAGVDRAGSHDEYALTLVPSFAEYEGKLCIEWGDGMRAWVQRADRQNKRVSELRTVFEEPPFPGFMAFISPLSKIDTLPGAWIEILKSCKGVYLLTCPTTKEQYVGSATGEECFWQRWQEYVRTGHGENVALKSRDPSDYQVSILEVAGTAATTADLLHMEARWKQKLQSKAMGLNKN